MSAAPPSPITLPAAPSTPPAAPPLSPPPQAEPPAFRHYLPALDGLRGVAILMVLTLHYFQFAFAQTPGVVGRSLDALVGLGWAGVDLFFVLSGYLITNILLHSRRQPRYFVNFYARRSLRIFPLYFALLLVVSVAAWMGQLAGINGAAALNRHHGWLWLYLTNVPAALGMNVSFGYFTHLWSLAVEEHFYLVWPAIVYLCATDGPRQRQLLYVSLALIAASIAIRIAYVVHDNRIAAYTFTLARMETLLVGSVAAFTTHAALARRRLTLLSLLAAAGLVALLILRGRLYLLDPLVATAGYSLVAIAGAGLVVAAAHAAPTSHLYRVLTTPLLRRLGLCSYGIYLLHFPILRGVAVVVKPTLLYSVPLAIVAGAITLALAALSYHLFERRFLELKRHFPTHASPTTRRDAARA